MITEKQKEEIKREVKKILDDFAFALEKVKAKRERIKKPIGGYRKEETGMERDRDFREKMFANAPSKEGNCIIAEKKKW